MIPTFTRFKDGTVFLNDVKRYVKPTILVPASTQMPVTTAAATSATNPTPSAPLPIEASQDGVVQIFASTGFNRSGVNTAVAARQRVQIYDTSNRRFWMNRSILVNHVFPVPEFTSSQGQSITPLYWDRAPLMLPQQTLLLTFENWSTAGAMNFDFAFRGRKFQGTGLARKAVRDFIEDERRASIFFSPFWLTTREDITVAAGGSITAFITPTKDIGMWVFKQMGSFISTGVAGNTTEGFQTTILDAQTGRPLQNRPVVRSAGWGTGGLPYMLPTPWYIPPNSKVQIQIDNLITDQATEVFLTLVGIADTQAPAEVWNAPGARPTYVPFSEGIG